MPLWMFVVLLSFTAPLGGAIEGVRTSESSPSSYVMAVLVGALVGAFGAWVSWTGFTKAQRRLGDRPYSAWQLRLIYLVGGGWGCILAMFGYWLARIIAN
jgi:H+/Cl- antiporter ClcA